ncbi:hypothetical protein HHI36_023031 [Cryptolaemus montrouzieri]|uniref:Immunoglobulin V-set domain-containing protein n=1 Tax=Cryptolaemus montrouzieri TaxID=559131 RepID=A0ABD2PF64_9CUCU
MFYQVLSENSIHIIKNKVISNISSHMSQDSTYGFLKRRIIIYIYCLQVAWIHIDRQMILTIHRHVISRIARFSVSHDNAKTWLLHVSSVQQEDRGYYMCQVNTNPMISQVGYLQVVGKLFPNTLIFEQGTLRADKVLS